MTILTSLALFLGAAAAAAFGGLALICILLAICPEYEHDK